MVDASLFVRRQYRQTAKAKIDWLSRVVAQFIALVYIAEVPHTAENLSFE